MQRISYLETSAVAKRLQLYCSMDQSRKEVALKVVVLFERSGAKKERSSFERKVKMRCDEVKWQMVAAALVVKRGSVVDADGCRWGSW